MKLTSKQLREIIQNALQEDLMRGIPEFMLQEISRKAIDELRQQLKRHILMVSSSEVSTREAMSAIEEPLVDLQMQLAQLLEDKVWSLLNKAGI